MMLTSKKGISSLQVQRIMGFGSYQTAHYMYAPHPRRDDRSRFPAS